MFVGKALSNVWNYLTSGDRHLLEGDTSVRKLHSTELTTHLSGHSERDHSKAEGTEFTSFSDRRVASGELNKEAATLRENYLRDMYGDCNFDDYEEARRGLDAISADTIEIILSAMDLYDNNDEFYKQLSRGELSSGYASLCSENEWQKLKSLDVGNIYIFGLLKYVEGDSRLEEEFGLYFVPSKAWMDIAVNKLRAKFLEGFSGEGLEVMAGKGQLSDFLNKDYDLKVTATDNFKTHQDIVSNTGHCTGIEVLNINAVSAIRTTKQAEFLIISWPPGDWMELVGSISPPQDVEILDAWACSGPILFIGLRRPHAGVWLTGSEVFHKKLSELYDAEVIKEYRGKSFAIRDEAVLFTPKKRKTDQSFQ